MTPNFKEFIVELPQFFLKTGLEVKKLPMLCWQYGVPNKNLSNVVVVTQGITCGANPFKWWPQVFEKTEFKNIKDICLVSVAPVGSSRSPFHPGSFKRATLENTDFSKQPQGFPLLTMQDSANILFQTLNQIGFNSCSLMLGGSFGGLQILNLVWNYPQFAKKALVFASSPLEGQALVVSKVQIEMLRAALSIDKVDAEQKNNLIKTTLASMRLLGNISYRSHENLASSFSHRKTFDFKSPFKRFLLSETFYNEADDFAEWFHPVSFLRLLEQLESFELKETETHLQMIKDCKKRTEFDIFAVENDFLMPKIECQKQMEQLARAGFNCNFKVLGLNQGHESWILDEHKVPEVVISALKEHCSPEKAI
jgi:homoserine O-acetyltransferase